MLAQRVVTAVILSAVVLWAILGWNNFWFAQLLLVFTFVGAWEWSNLTSVAPNSLRIAHAIIVTLVTAVCLWIIDTPALKPLALIGTIIWIVIICDLIVRPVVNAHVGKDKIPETRWLLLLLASFCLLLAVWSVYWLRTSHGPAIVIYTVALVAAADIGAYFSGRQFGKRKLAISISSGKTIEGALGGQLLALLLALFAIQWFTDLEISKWSLFIMSMVASVFSVAGDLFISRAKRTRNVKDSGSLLPGHGGVLDRIDGLQAALPLIVFALVWL